MVVVSPSFFTMAFYESIVHIVLRWPQYLDTARLPWDALYWSRTPITLAIGYYLLYVLWVLIAYFLGSYPPWWPFPQPLTEAGERKPRCPCVPCCATRRRRPVAPAPASRVPSRTLGSAIAGAPARQTDRRVDNAAAGSSDRTLTTPLLGARGRGSDDRAANPAGGLGDRDTRSHQVLLTIG